MSGSIHLRLGFSWDANGLRFPQPAADSRKPLFMLRKMMAEYVWDLVHLEDNPFSFVEVKTLLDGMTIGGHRVQDEQQVLNQHRALKFLDTAVKDSGSSIGKELAFQMHAKVAFEEALQWGKFRDGDVGIGGTSHRPPPTQELDRIYEHGLEALKEIERPFERALAYYFWGAMNQFFFDGNKRTSRAVMNFVLLEAGYFYLSVPGRRKDEFNSMMVEFYESKDATAGMRFMLDCYRDWN